MRGKTTMAKEKVMAPQRIILSMPADLRERVRAFRFAKQINTEAEAIRTLLDQALETNGFAAADQPKPRGKRRP
jgi:hypothetical protein